MTFLVVLLATLVVVVALKGAIKRFPVAFYVLCVAADVLFVAGTLGFLPAGVQDVLFLLLRKCTLALALFVIVMYVGVFARESKVRGYLAPIRAELSIMAWLLSLGHMVVYLMGYAPRIFGGAAHAMDARVLGSLALALVLFALLLVLGVTSFQFVKRRMTAAGWKAVQRWVYVFFGLVYAHLMLLLAPAALSGRSADVALNVGIYTVVFGAYALGRIRRAAKDRNVLQADSA